MGVGPSGRYPSVGATAATVSLGARLEPMGADGAVEKRASGRWTRARKGGSPRPHHHRVRVPQPLIKHRLPSGRGATEQPNTTGDGDTPLTVRFWLALLLTAVATGLLGDFMMVVLFGFEHLAFGTGPGDYQSHVERATALHRVASLAIAGAFAGPAWYLDRRWPTVAPAKLYLRGDLRDCGGYGGLDRSGAGPQADGWRLGERQRRLV